MNSITNENTTKSKLKQDIEKRKTNKMNKHNKKEIGSPSGHVPKWSDLTPRISIIRDHLSECGNIIVSTTVMLNDNNIPNDIKSLISNDINLLDNYNNGFRSTLHSFEQKLVSYSPDVVDENSIMDYYSTAQDLQDLFENINSTLTPVFRTIDSNITEYQSKINTNV